MSQEGEGFYLLGSWGTIPTTSPEVWLGRVVVDYKNPKASWAPSDASSFRGPIEDDPGYTDVSELLSSKKSSSIYGALADIFKFSTSDSSSSNPGIEAAKVRKLSIGQYDDVFERMQADGAVNAAVEKLRWKERTAYLIVGLLVTDQLAFTESSSSLSSSSFQGKVPTKEAMAAGGLPSVDFGPEGGKDKSQERGREGGKGISGTRIFAIQYRILKKHRKVFRGTETKLSDKILTGERTFGDEETGDAGEKALEMKLEEDVTLEDEVDEDDEERIFTL